MRLPCYTPPGRGMSVPSPIRSHGRGGNDGHKELLVPPSQLVFILAVFALIGNVLFFTYRLVPPSGYYLWCAIGCFIVAIMYFYLSINPDTSLTFNATNKKPSIMVTPLMHILGMWLICPWIRDNRSATNPKSPLFEPEGF